MRTNLVAVSDLGDALYPAAPFSPDWKFAEYPFSHLSSQSNRVYGAVRDALKLLGLDEARYGTPAWNPLGGIIKPGARVLVKPNLVRHYHPYGMDPRSIVTHGSIIRAICDYVWIALGGRGTLVIADAPLQTCDFAAAVRVSGLDELLTFYRSLGLEVELRDLRLVRAVAESKPVYGNVLVQLQNDGDPRGYSNIDLGEDSLHAAREVPPDHYRVTCYDPAKMRRHHDGIKHEYVVANSMLEADVIINIPKMKTHHKAGITGALKNFVGINGHKDCLPHHAKGSRVDGGDEYLHRTILKSLDSWMQDRKESGGTTMTKKAVAVAHRLLYRMHMGRKDSFWEGSWYGNDTISRTTVDLNRIVRFAGRNGIMQATPQRQVFTVIDGVIAGELDGPLAPTPKPAGVVLAGANPVAVDMVMARLMGFRGGAIPTLRHAVGSHRGVSLIDFPPQTVETRSATSEWNQMAIDQPGESFEFRPHRGWEGHVEL